jgi:hypothetical protein
LADSGGTSPDAAGPLESGKRLRLGLTWIVAAVILAAIIGGVTVWKWRTPEPLPVVRFEVDLPAGQQFVDLSSPLLAVSPDGKKFVYNTSSGLYLRSMDQPTAKLILGADKNPKQPFFSPDGQWVGYWSSDENQLKKVSIRGGAPVHITDVAGDPVLPSWGVHDAIVYGQYGTGKIMRIPGSGGTPELLFEQKGNLIFAPQMLPGGKSVLFTQQPLLQTEHLETQPRISPDGQWMAYTSGESLGERLKGEVFVRSFPEVDKVKYQVSNTGGSSPLWSPDGRELYYLSEDNFAMAVAVEKNPVVSFGTPRKLFRNPVVGISLDSGTPWTSTRMADDF